MPEALQTVQAQGTLQRRVLPARGACHPGLWRSIPSRRAPSRPLVPRWAGLPNSPLCPRLHPSRLQKSPGRILCRRVVALSAPLQSFSSPPGSLTKIPPHLRRREALRRQEACDLSAPSCPRSDSQPSLLQQLPKLPALQDPRSDPADDVAVRLFSALGCMRAWTHHGPCCNGDDVI